MRKGPCIEVYEDCKTAQECIRGHMISLWMIDSWYMLCKFNGIFIVTIKWSVIIRFIIIMLYLSCGHTLNLNLELCIQILGSTNPNCWYKKCFPFVGYPMLSVFYAPSLLHFKHLQSYTWYYKMINQLMWAMKKSVLSL